MPAEITYNAGASYRIGKHKFMRGATQTVDDEAVIERCRMTVGFTVRALAKQKVPPVAKKVRPVATAPVEKDEDKPKKKKRSYDE